MSRRCAHKGWVVAGLASALIGAGFIAEASAQTAATPPAGPPAKAAAAKKPVKPAAGPDAAKEAKRDPAESQRTIEAGIASYNVGKHEQAVQQLSAALSGGKLPAAQMARALYYRGAAYRKQSKPANAISDLTSALYLKNGLSDTDRADATAQRAAAYREAGLPDQADPAAAKQAAAKPAPDPAPAATPKAALARAESAADAAAKRTAAAPEAAPPAPTSSGGGFFSNLFGGGSSAAPAAVAKPAPVQPQTSGWSEQVQVKRAAAPAPAADAPAQRGAPAAGSAAPATAKAAIAAPAKPIETAAVPRATAPAAPTGRYQLQVAAVRSRAEAQAVAERFKQQHAKELAARQTIIDEANVGSMGTFYRVRLGPFADASEPRELCGRLRVAGVDCMLVTP